jgi:alpha-tubulin suppressor-like RCC1 family protein
MRRLCSFSSVPLSIVGLLVITTAASLTPLADAVPSSHLAAAASGAKISAHLTKTSFTSAQASSVKLIYKFSKKSDSFSYLLTFKKSSKWQTVKSVKKKGSFNGSKSVAAKKIFAGKPIKVGSYRLKLSADQGSKRLRFKVVKASSDGPTPKVAVLAVSAGGGYTCTLLSDHRIECWGYGSWGQLGNGTTSSSPIPIQVSGITNATQVSTGYYNTCALLSDGTVKCWGDNLNGLLGNGTTTNSSIPVQVNGITSATAISASDYHTCALLSDGTVKCWGANYDGAISAGGAHTCALLSGGSIECWGYGRWGQLGNGTTSSSPIPVQVSGITSATAISAGSDHTCALLADHSVECFGFNRAGQLGDGTMTDSSTPVPVSAVTNATAIVADDDHTCALLGDSTVECWGYNQEGQLGDGVTNHGYQAYGFDASPSPVHVSGITSATAIGAGYYHACAVLTSTTVECWGDNNDGELGDGTTTSSSTPVSVVGLH